MGTTYQELNVQDKAIEFLKTAWQLDPKSSATELANVYLENGKPLVAVEILLKTLDRVPDSSERLEWWKLLGNTLRDQNKLDDAIFVYREAIAEFPDEPLLYIGLGWSIYENDNDQQTVERLFNRAIELDVTDGYNYFTMGMLKFREEHYAQADLWYQEALKRDPNNRWYIINYANNLRSLGELSSALEIYLDITENNPSYARAFYEIAWAYHLSNQPEEAKSSIKKALSLLSQPDEWYFVRAGIIFESTGDIETAQVYYKNALKINPRNQAAIEGLSRLGE
jgi:tetratricopeptide (TPR) repeat protein